MEQTKASKAIKPASWMDKEVAECLSREYGHEHPGWTEEKWIADVVDKKTRCGYWEWVACQLTD